MKKILSVVLALVFLLTGCLSGVCEGVQAGEPTFKKLSDPKLTGYMEDAMEAEIAASFDSDDYVVESVKAVYISQEYLDGLAFNSQANVFFGYSLSDLDAQFSGTRYIFTLGDNNETVVQPLQGYDDTYERVLQNVAVGTGVILICVTVSVVTAGAGAPAVSMIFAAAAKTGTSMALSSGAISGIAAGIATGYQTGDFDEAVKAAALQGSESFKWGAITGAIAGGANEAITIAKDSAALAKAGDSIPTWQESERNVAEAFHGESQVSYLNGEPVPYGTPGATRPDVLVMEGDNPIAIEVKNYTLDNPSSLNALKTELKRQIGQRVEELPSGFNQEVVLDVTGRGYTVEFMDDVVTELQGFLFEIYPDLPIIPFGL